MGDQATPTPSQVADLDEVEAKRILVSIARASSSDSARISAIRFLRELKAQTPDKPAEKVGFDALDEVSEKRNERGAA